MKALYMILLLAEVFLLNVPAVCYIEETGGKGEWELVCCVFLTVVVLAVMLIRKVYSSHYLSTQFSLFLPLGILWELLLIFALNCSTLFSMSVATLALLPVPVLSVFLAEQTAELSEIRKREQQMQKWQQESRDYMNVIRSQRHDYNVHLHAVVGLIENEDYEECRHYLRKMAAEASEINDIMPVSDAVIGSMLYNMRREARRRGSDIIYDIRYDMADVLCNSFECNKIIGNLLQNALDAMTEPEDIACGIRMEIFKRRGNTVITVENRFTGDKTQIARVFEAGYSTKKNHEGIGLPMALRTVSRYGGRIYPEFEEDRIRFVVNLPNKVHLQEENP